jgi:hypothetical protein
MCRPRTYGSRSRATAPFSTASSQPGLRIPPGSLRDSVVVLGCQRSGIWRTDAVAVAGRGGTGAPSSSAGTPKRSSRVRAAGALGRAAQARAGAASRARAGDRRRERLRRERATAQVIERPPTYITRVLGERPIGPERRAVWERGSSATARSRGLTGGDKALGADPTRSTIAEDEPPAAEPRLVEGSAFSATWLRARCKVRRAQPCCR